jgi:hypothetical protein
MSTCGQRWQPPGSTLAFLRGTWQADRRLADFRSSQQGSFAGTAAFSDWTDALPEGPPPDGGWPEGGLAYREQGELRFGGHQGPASRSLLYLPAPDGSAEVLFADRRPFYRLDLRSGCWQAEHPCNRDLYTVAVRVLGPDCFTEQWRTRGPGKDYEITTTLTRTRAAR